MNPTVIGGFSAATKAPRLPFGEEDFRLFARAMLLELSAVVTFTALDSRRIEARYVLETRGRSVVFTFSLDANEIAFACLAKEFATAQKIHALLTGKDLSK